MICNNFNESHRISAEDFFLNDPELQDEIPSTYLSHKELHEYAMRKAVIISRKLKQLQAEGKVGINDYQ